MISLLVSCNNDLLDHSSEPIHKYSQTEVFSIKIDSINNLYSSLNNSDSTRASWLSHAKDYAIAAPADAVGGFIGSKLGSWVGASIGVACSNPAIAAIGYLGGRKLGCVAGAAAASISVAWAIDNFGKKTRASDGLVLNEQYTVAISNSHNLSDGELHNLIVSKLLKDIDKYVISDGELNYYQLISDALAIENEIRPSEEYTKEYIDAWVPKVVEQTKRIVYSSPSLIEGDANTFLNKVYDKLIPEISVSKEEFDKANILNEKTLSTYRYLDKNSILNYSKDIDRVIEDSEFDGELKEELKSSNNIMLNSTLIWREVN